MKTTFHVIFQTLASAPIAPDPRAQRIVAELVHAMAEPFGLLAFRVAGDHLHVAVECDRARAGKLAQRIGSALKQRLRLPGFTPTYFKPVKDQDHLEEVFFYILRNTEKHGVTNDPTHEASSIGALLGLRPPAGQFLTRVRQAIPTLTRDVLLTVLGVKRLEGAFRLDQLVDAAAGAVGAVELAGASGVRAKFAALRVAVRYVTLGVAAKVLGVSERRAREFRAAPAEPVLERAIELRMGLLAEMGDRARLDAPVLGRQPWQPGRRALLRR